MKLLSHPALLDQLAASYALGTLRGGARRRFEALARQSPAVRSAALLWGERLSSLTELQPQQVPSVNVWKRIENLLAAQQAQTEQAQLAQTTLERSGKLIERLYHRASVWRWGAVAGVGALAVLLPLSINTQHQLRGELAQSNQRLSDGERQRAHLQAQLAAMPRVEYVAVLADERSQPIILLTFDAQTQRLTVKRVSSYAEPAQKSLQLWAVQAQGAPKSLGVLAAQTVLQLNAASALIQQTSVLAISLEPQGGVSGERGPSGPVLFKGAVLRTAL